MVNRVQHAPNQLQTSSVSTTEEVRITQIHPRVAAFRHNAYGAEASLEANKAILPKTTRE
jgi:hypothetical protein